VIRITYEARHALPLDEVADFQGDAKTITRGNLDKLKRSIKKHGFFVPLFVWRKGSTTYIIDGHQRRKALLELRDEGEEVPPIPVEYIDAKSKKDAAEKLLAITSQFGEFDVGFLEAWTTGLGVNLPLLDVRLVDVELSFDVPEYEVPERNKEIDEDAMRQTEHECPSCGFKW
jgi:hypothetical protein